ncbi:glutamate--tRNA ligase, cytoplasmic [Tanacetum coccineum]
MRVLAISSNLEITLMDWGNASVEEIKDDTDGNMTDLKGVLHPKGSFKATELKLMLLLDINELAPLNMVEFGYLIKKKKVIDNTFYKVDSTKVFGIAKFQLIV